MEWYVLPLFIVGLLCLIKGGDWFVDGASGIAKKFKIPEILIGATVVSIGTTLPEVMVSATSAAQGIGDIAFGNSIGSIICNTSLIAAITIAVKPGKADRKTMILPVSFFVGASIFYCLTAYIGGRFTRLSGIILLVGFVAYMTTTVLSMKKNGGEEEVLVELPEKADSSENGGECVVACEGENAQNSDTGAAVCEKKTFDKEILIKIGLMVVGAALIAVGARLLVDNATLIAKAVGLSDAIIGLTIVALGTSLPELVTAITSLIKGHGSLSLGNIIGANLFNLILVSGMAIAISPFDVPKNDVLANGALASLVIDIPVMLGVMAILVVPALIRGKMSRVQGISLLTIYVAYLVARMLLV